MRGAADLISKLDDESVSVREAAVEGLVALGGRAVPALVDAFRRAVPSSRYALVARTLKTIGSAAFEPVYAELEAAGSRDQARRWCMVLSDMGSQVLPLYVRALHHPAEYVRDAALVGMMRLKEQALPAAGGLVAMLAEPDRRLRSRLIFTLSQLGDGAVPLLQDVRRHGPGRSRAAALECLVNIGGEEVLSSQDRAAVDRLIRVKLLDDRPAPISCCFLSWIAVSTGEQEQLVDLLGLSKPRPVTFALGTAVADNDSHRNAGGDLERFARVFVTPEIAGWTLVVGAWADPSDPDRAREVAEICMRASAVFGKARAFWFGAQNDGSAWLVADHGVVRRRASAIDEATDELLELGTPLPEEEALLGEVDDASDREFLLMEFAPKLAALLSLDPLSITADNVCRGTGQLALTPIGTTHRSPVGALRF